MKANRKYKENEEAVSAVIGVILMVAITVAIAATVYVYVSGMIGGGSQTTPTISCTTDASADKLIVSSAENGIDWDDIEIKTDTANATLSLNGGAANDTGTTWVTVSNTNFVSSGDVSAGDYFLVAGTDVEGDVEITIRYSPTNALIGTWKVNV